MTQGPPPKPKPPSSLRKAGKAAWVALMEDPPEDWLFTERELQLIFNACRQRDLVADLEAAVKKEGVMIEGAAGQTRLNAAVTELRQSRLAFARLVGEIGLPEDEGQEPKTSASERGRKAANARWSRERQRLHGARR